MSERSGGDEAAGPSPSASPVSEPPRQWPVRYRQGLRSAVGTSAGPYGYTLTIWTSGAVLIHERGLPSSADALLFMAGSVVAFAVLGALAFRRGEYAPDRRPRHPVLWGSFHFLPVASAIGVVTALSTTVEGDPVWPLAGLAATAIYLILVGAQIAVFSESPREALARLREGERELAAELREELERTGRALGTDPPDSTKPD